MKRTVQLHMRIEHKTRPAQTKMNENEWSDWAPVCECLLLSTLSQGLQGREKIILFRFVFVLNETRNSPKGYIRINASINPWIYFKRLTNDKNKNISISLLRLPYRFPEAMMPLPRLATQAQSILLEIPGDRNAS